MHVNKNILKYIIALSQKKVRHSSGSYLIEGYKLIEEALLANVSFEFVLTRESSRNNPIYKKLNDNGIVLYWASDREFSQTTQLINDEGILAVVKRPVIAEPVVDGNFLLVLDHINDPGNLGTIIRTADWFGLKSLYLSQGCVDPYSPKVVRATMGSIFHLNIYEHVDIHPLLVRTKRDGYYSFATTLDGVDIDARIKNIDKKILLMGSESHGIDPDLIRLCDTTVKIKGVGRAESLNVAVATGILLYEIV